MLDASHITLLAPSREALNNIFDVCREYARHIIYYSMLVRPKYMYVFDKTHSILFDNMFNSWGTIYVLLINVFLGSLDFS